MSACTHCVTFENNACMLGEKCCHYSEENIRAEAIRRKLAKAEYHEKEAARLRKEAEALTHDNH